MSIRVYFAVGVGVEDSAHALGSNSPSHLATTMAATALPMVLVMALGSDMKRSMPSRSARPSAGRPPAVTHPAHAPEAPPVPPAAPLLVNRMTTNQPRYP